MLRTATDPLSLDDFVQAYRGRPVSGFVLLSLRAVSDAAVKASAVPLPSPASVAGHAAVAPATAAAPSSGGAVTPSSVSAPADGRPTAGAAAQPSSGDASGCGDSATHSFSSSEGEDEESTVDENESPVVSVTCKTWERPFAAALVFTESHNPNNSKCAQAVDDTVRLCNLHLAPRYMAFGTRTWANLIGLWREKNKTSSKIVRGWYWHKGRKKGKEDQAPEEVVECTYDLLIAAAPEVARPASTGPHEWLQDIVRRMAADKKYVRRRVGNELTPASWQKAVLHWARKNPKQGIASDDSLSAPSS